MSGTDNEKNADWWWIDFLESDLDPSILPDIEYLLTHSESDQDEFERWRSLRQWVNESDPVAKGHKLWTAEELDSQREQILNAVRKLETAEKTQEVALRLV